MSIRNLFKSSRKPSIAKSRPCRGDPQSLRPPCLHLGASVIAQAEPARARTPVCWDLCVQSSVGSEDRY